MNDSTAGNDFFDAQNPGFTDEEERMIELQAASFERAMQAIEDRKRADEARWQQEEQDNHIEPEPVEPYDEKYFITKTILLVFAPVLALVAVLIVCYIVHSAFIGTDSVQFRNVVIFESAVIIVCLWWIVRQAALGYMSGIYVDESGYNPKEPRILWLGLVGSNSAFSVQEISVTDYSESFWNFIPGWNSWVLQMDTAAQNDKKLQMVKHVKDADRIVQIINPGMNQSKNKLFKRR